MEKRNLDKIFSPQTGLIDTQKAVPTTGPTNCCRNDRQKSLNAKWWKTEIFQKQSSKNLLGHVVSSCDKFAQLFFEEKKRWFSVQVWKNINKTQTKTLSKQGYDHKLILRTRRMQFRQVDQERFEHIWQIFVECPKLMGERHFWQNFFFTTNCCNGQTQSSFGDNAQNFLSECQKKNA